MSWKEAELAVLMVFIFGAILYMANQDPMKHAPDDVLFLVDKGVQRLEQGAYISGRIDGRIRHMSVYKLLDGKD